MFEIAVNKEGVACIVTDNPVIAEAIRREAPGCDVPVWFTGSPNLKVAKGLVKGLEAEFGRKACVCRGAGPDVFHAAFVEPAREGAAVSTRLAKLHKWLSEHESMLAEARTELNAVYRDVTKPGVTKRGAYTYSPDGADPYRSPWPFKVEPSDTF